MAPAARMEMWRLVVQGPYIGAGCMTLEALAVIQGAEENIEMVAVCPISIRPCRGGNREFEMEVNRWPCCPWSGWFGGGRSVVAQSFPTCGSVEAELKMSLFVSNTFSSGSFRRVVGEFRSAAVVCRVDDELFEQGQLFRGSEG